MATKPRKWPSYALAALEDSLIELQQASQLTRNVQVQIEQDNRLAAVILTSDIREVLTNVTSRLARARTGEYLKGDY